MADMKIGYEQVLAHRKTQPALPTAVVYPCSGNALIGAVEAAKAGLIALGSLDHRTAATRNERRRI